MQHIHSSCATGSEQLSKALQEMVAEIEKLNSIANELTLLYS
ncbi:hypothetical protein [Desulforamulus hydrothermalis]|uniref:Uncharacterized protein n=1 Tax=Desulforamulus hydrothermalis Lam5 = DSM 18033 TaxID=1121428 RepID=K8DZH0_9FIRM|nr:hypothetical protein [Desulforamulus hydrothermalis]CCO08365.1 hypothetical protein DESHY_30055 [Desulforamulus hydrothermalis Lam5 = DSM 18033]